ncbi:MAG: TIGR02757 family protein [Leptospira sp.]|nr:TIGR02757 family protein [Leptospira sp.]
MPPLSFPSELKEALNQVIEIYNHPKYLSTDPICFPKEYNSPLDIEVISLLTCLFAYGNVKAIRSFLSPLFLNLGPSPYLTLATKNSDYHNTLKNISYYRFQTREDNLILLKSISEILTIHYSRRSQKPIFESLFLNDNELFIPFEGISNFQSTLETQILTTSKQKQLTRGLCFLIGDPKAKSAKKRICLFLRWMVRKNFPDFGLYQKIKSSDIPFPLDVHIQRLIRILGISQNKTYGLKESLLIRDYFRKLSPEDPLLYDFYLTRVGMIQKCQGKRINEICSECKLERVCLIGSATGN